MPQRARSRSLGVPAIVLLKCGRYRTEAQSASLSYAERHLARFQMEEARSHWSSKYHPKVLIVLRLTSGGVRGSVRVPKLDLLAQLMKSFRICFVHER